MMFKSTPKDKKVSSLDIDRSLSALEGKSTTLLHWYSSVGQHDRWKSPSYNILSVNRLRIWDAFFFQD